INGGGGTDGLIVASGELVLQNVTLSNVAGNALTVDAGTEARIDGGTFGGAVAVAGTGVLTAEAGSVTGNVALASGGELEGFVAAGVTATVSGNVGGAGSVAVGRASQITGGTLSLSGSNNYSGGSTILDGSTLDIANSGAAGTGTITFDAVAGAVLEIDGTTMPTNSIQFTVQSGTIHLANVGATGTQILSLGSNGTLSIPGTSDVLTFVGLPTGTQFVLASDSRSGSTLNLLDETTAVTSEAQLAAVVAAAAALPAESGMEVIVNLPAGALAIGSNLSTVLASGDSINLVDGAAPGSISIAAGVTLDLGGTSSYSGGTTIGAGGTLELADSTAGGPGSISFSSASGTLRLDGTTMPANAIAGMQIGDVVNLTGIAYVGRLSTNASGVLTIPSSNAGNVTLTFSGLSPDSPFNLAKDGNGTDITLLQSAFTASSAATYDAALSAMSNGGADAAPSAAYTISLATSLSSLTLNASTPTVALPDGATLTIAGNGETIQASGSPVLDVSSGGVILSDVAVSGEVDTAAGTALTIDASASLNPTNGTIAGSISGAGVLTLGSNPASAATGGTLVLSGDDNYAGGTVITNDSTLDIASGAVAGTGAITFESPDGAVLQIDGATMPQNAIDFASGNGLVHLTSEAVASTQVLALAANNTLSIPLADGGSAVLNIGGSQPGTNFVAFSDGSGGTYVALQSQSSALTTTAEFIAAVSALSALPANAGVNDVFALNGVLTLSGTLATNLPAGGALEMTDGVNAGGGFVIASNADISLQGNNSFSAGITLDTDATLDVSSSSALGDGPITFAGPGATLAIGGTTAPSNAI
ncbi:MAG TPA: hypothetical protein VGD75_03735, partial [Bradyrhizobium sp.]